MPRSLAQIYVGQRSRTGDATGTGSGSWGNGISAWGFDMALLPGALHNALGGSLFGGALSGYLASTGGGHSKRPATSDYPRGQPSNRPNSGGRPATSGGPPSRGRPWSSDSDVARPWSSGVAGADLRGGDNTGRLGGRLACIVPSEQARRALQSERFEPQSAQSALLLSGPSPRGMQLAPLKPRSRSKVRDAILKDASLKEDDVGELVAAGIWGTKNDILQMKQRTLVMRKRTVELMQRAEEAELQYSEQFLLPPAAAIEPGAPPAASEASPATGAKLTAIEGCATGAGSEAEAQADEVSKTGISHICERASPTSESATAAEAAVSKPGKRASAKRQGCGSSSSLKRCASRDSLTSDGRANAIAAATSTANIGADSGVTLDKVLEGSESNPEDASVSHGTASAAPRRTQPGRPIGGKHASHSPSSSRQTVAAHPRQVKQHTPRGSRDSSGIGQKPSISQSVDKKETQGKNINKRTTIVEPEESESKAESKAEGKDGKASPTSKDSSHSPSKKTLRRGRSFSQFLQHAPGSSSGSTPRTDERKVFEVSRKMEIEGKNTSLALVSMFLSRTSGDLRIHVLLMSNKTDIELNVQAAHLEDLFQHVMQHSDRPGPVGSPHSHGHSQGTRNTKTGGRNKSVVASPLEIVALQRDTDNEADEDAYSRQSTGSLAMQRRATTVLSLGSPTFSSSSPREGRSTRFDRSSSPREAAPWERLSAIIQVDKDAFAVRGLSLQVLGWQRPDERKAVEQLEVRSDFADIFHKTQEDMKRNRFVAQ